MKCFSYTNLLITQIMLAFPLPPPLPLSSFPPHSPPLCPPPLLPLPSFLPSPPPPPRPAHQRPTSQAHVRESGAAFLLDILPHCTAQETAQLAQVSHTHAPILEGAACCVDVCWCVRGCMCAWVYLCVGGCWRADSVVCAVQHYSGDQG